MKVFKWWQQHLLLYDALYSLRWIWFTKNLNIMHLSLASPLADPGEPTGTQGEWYSFGISFFPEEEGSNFAGSWEHTHGTCLSFDQWSNPWPDQDFFEPFCFISMPNFNIICCGCSYFPLGKSYLSLNFMPFTQRLWMACGCYGKQFPRGVPGFDPQGSIW